jgi:hypothetical protein
MLSSLPKHELHNSKIVDISVFQQNRRVKENRLSFYPVHQFKKENRVERPWLYFFFIGRGWIPKMSRILAIITSSGETARAKRQIRTLPHAWREPRMPRMKFSAITDSARAVFGTRRQQARRQKKLLRVYAWNIESNCRPTRGMRTAGKSFWPV